MEHKRIGRYLRAGVMIDGQCYPTRVEGWRKTSPYPIFIVFLAIECFPVRRFLNLDQIKRTCRSVWKFLRGNDDLLISDHHDVDFELPGEEALETLTPGVDPVTVPHSLGNTGQVD
ncbi:hypothetical protein [Endozoicomonas sp. SESOKO2]|uniref:hypothetical protein n=1 Tax=Endozoicomonas sp. SESOKO2 TaxID=2828743 RepID=UPI002147C75C|nr:hypothetical protein [Endozoicomonas sp. SESOKO2]